MTQEILIRLTPNSKPEAIIPRAHFAGKYGYVMLGPVQIGSQAGALAALLRSLADQLEPKPMQNHKPLIQSFPSELDTPETGWPWLIKHRPWIFKGIKLSSEPYAHYLESDNNLADHIATARAKGCNENSSKADVSFALTGKRKYGGSDYYDLIEPVWNALQASSTGKSSSKSVILHKKAA